MMRLVLLFLMLSCSLAKAQNRNVTPGAVRPLSTARVCEIRWGLDRRHVTEAMKRQVAANYGLKRSDVRGSGACCEFDHLIPRELGGADVVENLWPQPWAEARTKDVLENRAHAAVCRGEMKLRTAQLQFAVNWRDFHVMHAPQALEIR